MVCRWKRHQDCRLCTVASFGAARATAHPNAARAAQMPWSCARAARVAAPVRGRAPPFAVSPLSPRPEKAPRAKRWGAPRGWEGRPRSARGQRARN
eukprot:15440896-Alexandrium_andersonii.AAC.1